MTRRFWHSILVISLFFWLNTCSDSFRGHEEERFIKPSALAPSSPSLTPHSTYSKNSSPTHTPSPTKIQLPVVTRVLLEAPSTITPTIPTCWSEGGSIHNASLKSVYLRNPLDFRVYLPPCYHQQSDRSYPVLYLIHGKGFTDEQWDRIGIDEAANNLIASNEIPPLIVIMPYEQDIQPPQISKFSQAFIEDLVPHVDKTYRTLPDRFHRAIGGLSRGGGWAIHFGISEWELFGALGAHSPGIFPFDNMYMQRWLDNIPRDSIPRIYIDIGSRDLREILEPVVHFEELLNDRDIPHEWHYFSGFHNEDYWHTHLESYLRWYTQTW